MHVYCAAKHCRPRQVALFCNCAQLANICPKASARTKRSRRGSWAQSPGLQGGSELTPGVTNASTACGSGPRAVPAAVNKAAGDDVFIFGLGYCGVALAAELSRQHWHVSGTCRDQEACSSFREEHIDAHVFDADNDIPLSVDAQRALESASYVITTVPPNGDADQDPVLLAAECALQKCASSYKWVGYLSSTGVYGDHKGAWVDESSATSPTDAKAIARLRGEQAWLALHHKAGLPVHIFRLGGIYGPGRSVLDAVAQQKSDSQRQRRSRQRFTARCHVHDICQVLLASIKQPNPGAIYNIVDNEPAPRSVTAEYARQLLFPNKQRSALVAETTVSEDNQGEPVQTRLAEKRVCNAKLDELGVVLKFPTYREGLSAIHARNLTPFIRSGQLAVSSS